MKQTLLNPFEVFDARLTEIQSLLVEIRHKKELPTIGTPEAPDRYLSGEETQKLLGGVSAPTLWDWRKKGFVHGYRIGNKVMYKYSELMQCGKKITL